MDCSIGKKVSSFKDAAEYVNSVRKAMKGQPPESDSVAVERYVTIRQPTQVSTVNSILLMAIPVDK